MHSQDLEVRKSVSKRSAPTRENRICRKTLTFCHCLLKCQMGEAGLAG